MELFTGVSLYFLIAVGLFILLQIYFRVAIHYQIIDVPNHRSSHSEVTIRGGGIIFALSFLLYGIFVHDISYILLAGLLAISIISFIDDISELQIRYRLPVHLLAVTALIYAVGGFQMWPLPLILIVYILILGGINAYNFMDGVNGITGLYSLVVFSSLLYVNQLVAFTDSDFIVFGMLACIVFLFFNFRKRARCFAGDVGSVGVAFWVISLILMLVVYTSELKYILFLTVYGVDAVLTIIHRLYLRQDILKAHRLHFYQILANENKIPHLWVSTLYAALQLFVNVLIIYSDWDFLSLFLVINTPLCLTYFMLKPRLMKSYHG